MSDCQKQCTSNRMRRALKKLNLTNASNDRDNAIV